MSHSPHSADCKNQLASSKVAQHDRIFNTSFRVPKIFLNSLNHRYKRRHAFFRQIKFVLQSVIAARNCSKLKHSA